jgi:hypothetical protein
MFPVFGYPIFESLYLVVNCWAGGYKKFKKFKWGNKSEKLKIPPCNLLHAIFLKCI